MNQPIPLYTEICPGVGLGTTIKFGMSESEVLTIVGAWESRWFNEEGDLRTSYANGRSFLSFDKEDDFRLTGIEVAEQSRLSLFGRPAFPGTRQTVWDLLTHTEDIAEEDIVIDAFGSPCIYLPELCMQFFFEDDELDAISWGPLFNDDDEIIWPRRNATEIVSGTAVP